MTEFARQRRGELALIAAVVVGIVGCIAGLALDTAGFFRAWLCAFLLWLGVPLCGVTLVLVHDLTGGEWMAAARPILNAAIATMPLAMLAGIPAFVGLHAIYGWTHAAPGLGNAFYLNQTGFVLRYIAYVVLWNGLAAFALLAPRGPATPIAPALSWLSAVGLIVLAVSASFAAIDWILSLEPGFWSSVFPMAAGASWFNTGMAMVLLVVAVRQPPSGVDKRHMADLAAILLATTMFWAYVEFMQFLIVWEEDLKFEIPWYLARLHGVWGVALAVSVGLGFFVPFFILLWGPAKRSRGLVIAACLAILVSRVADRWWLVFPEFSPAPPLWLAVAAVLALGGAVLLLFGWGLNRALRWPVAERAALRAGHG